jgi:HK97 family phage portal protein
MFSSLLSIVRDAGSYQGGSAEVGQPASNTRVRRFGSNLESRSTPDPKSDKQLDAFRGTTYAAVDKIARRIAQIKINLLTCEHDEARNEILKTRTYFHPFLTLFSEANGHRPHPEYSVWEMNYQASISLDLAGELWWLVERDNMGLPARVTPLPANRMVIVFSKETGLTAGYFFVPKGSTVESGAIFIPKRDWNYLHIHPKEPFIYFERYPGPKGIEDARGWSPIKAAAFAYDINQFEMIYKRNFLAQGAQLGGILQSEVALSKDQIEEYLEQFKTRHQGLEKAGLPMVLPKMLKWTTTEPTPRDLQWVEAMKLTESQILQIFGVSDAKLGRADIGNRNTSEAVDVTFNREVIKSRLDARQSKMNTDFLPIYKGQTDKLYFSVEYEDPIPADTDLQMKREKQDIDLNVITRNELRKKRGEQPMGKFGDQVWMPLTHVAVDPFEQKLELSQDDADKLGFVDPKEQAKLDAAVAAAKPKNDNKDGKGASNNKDK